MSKRSHMATPRARKRSNMLIYHGANLGKSSWKEKFVKMAVSELLERPIDFSHGQTAYWTPYQQKFYNCYISIKQ